MTDKLEEGLEIIYAIADKVEEQQIACSVAHDSFREKFKPGLVEVVYEWARGMVRVFIQTVQCLGGPSIRRVPCGA